MRAGFASVGGLGAVHTPYTYNEGGFNASPHQLPNWGQYTPVTCSRGVLLGGHDEIAQWYRSGITVGAGNAPFFATSCVISVFQHPGQDLQPGLVFNLAYAWCTALQFSDLDAGGNAFEAETMQISHLGWSIAFS